ncbi:golgin subfamily A member 6-like protein 4 [Schistocerca americana]|uniref:golgin subfamily A member 6-like protein 4 n=1 Tax=Schistocerca americana TaxID=7009 RepID=UPI001F4F156F|nr:golgin subfamily A member 6-like protein 4 [Schistocerca americana]
MLHHPEGVSNTAFRSQACFYELGQDLCTLCQRPSALSAAEGGALNRPRDQCKDLLVWLEERDRERDQKLAQMLCEQEQQREQKEREKERMSEQREKQRDEKLAQMLYEQEQQREQKERERVSEQMEKQRGEKLAQMLHEQEKKLTQMLHDQRKEFTQKLSEQEQRSEAKLDSIQSKLAEMWDACKEIPDLVQSLAGEMQKLQISQARLEDNVQTFTTRVDNVEIDARKSIDTYLEVQAQKVDKEFNEWLEVKDREISANIESDVKTAVEQATAAASVNIDASAAALHAELTQIKSRVTAELPNWQQEVARILTVLKSNVNSG